MRKEDSEFKVKSQKKELIYVIFAKKTANLRPRKEIHCELA